MEENVFYEGQVIWAQIDANRHLRHSAYADICAQARSNMLEDTGLSLSKIAEVNIGPVLFREELVYLREIHLNEYVKVTVVMSSYNTINSRFSFRHEIFRLDGTKCAVVNVDGAWMDIVQRKLTVLPSEWRTIVERLPKAEDFREISA